MTNIGAPVAATDLKAKDFDAMRKAGTGVTMDGKGKVTEITVDKRGTLLCLERRYPVRRVFLECRREKEPAKKQEDEEEEYELFIEVCLHVDKKEMEMAVVRLTDAGLETEALVLVEHVAGLLCKELQVDRSRVEVLDSKNPLYPTKAAFKPRFFYHVGLFEPAIRDADWERRPVFPGGQTKKKKDPEGKKRKHEEGDAEKKEDEEPKKKKAKTSPIHVFPIFSDRLGCIIDINDAHGWLMKTTVGKMADAALEWCMTNAPLIVP
jgi:hypothetical protein